MLACSHNTPKRAHIFTVRASSLGHSAANGNASERHDQIIFGWSKRNSADQWMLMKRLPCASPFPREKHRCSRGSPLPALCFCALLSADGWSSEATLWRRTLVACSWGHLKNDRNGCFCPMAERESATSIASCWGHFVQSSRLRSTADQFFNPQRIMNHVTAYDAYLRISYYRYLHRYRASYSSLDIAPINIQGMDSIIGTVQILLPYFNDLLYQVLIEEWLKIPLGNVRKLHDSIPRRIQAVLKAERGSNYSVQLQVFQLFCPPPVDMLTGGRRKNSILANVLVLVTMHGVLSATDLKGDHLPIWSVRKSAMHHSMFQRLSF